MYNIPSNTENAYWLQTWKRRDIMWSRCMQFSWKTSGRRLWPVKISRTTDNSWNIGIIVKEISKILLEGQLVWIFFVKTVHVVIENKPVLWLDVNVEMLFETLWYDSSKGRSRRLQVHLSNNNIHYIPQIGILAHSKVQIGQISKSMSLKDQFCCQLEYWQSQEGPRRALRKLAGAVLKFLKRRSKVTFKVTCQNLRYCQKGHVMRNTHAKYECPIS